MFDTKIKNQFLRISLTAFVLSLVPQIINEVMLIIERSIPGPPDMTIRMFLGYTDLWLVFTIAPFLIFGVFYFVGRKPDLTLELRPIIIALLIGNIASLVIGSIIYTAIVAPITVLGALLYMLQFILVFFPAGFLAGLAGLSIGYTRRKKLTLIAESKLS